MWKFLKNKQDEIKSGTKVGRWKPVHSHSAFLEPRKMTYALKVPVCPALRAFLGYGTLNANARKDPGKADELVITSVLSSTVPNDWLSRV